MPGTDVFLEAGRSLVALNSNELDVALRIFRGDLIFMLNWETLLKSESWIRNFVTKILGRFCYENEWSVHKLFKTNFAKKLKTSFRIAPEGMGSLIEIKFRYRNRHEIFRLHTTLSQNWTQPHIPWKLLSRCFIEKFKISTRK